MASTNKTTHYELTQYVANDKPTYLVDHNDDMSKIDTAIYNAHLAGDTANENAQAAQTSAGNAQQTANTAVTNAGQAQETANTNSTHIGNLANLQTASKENLVGAINEVKSSLDTTSTNVGKLMTSKTLFQSAQGVLDTVTLSEIAENYDILEIFYSSGSRAGSVRIANFTNNEKLSLNVTGISASTFVNVVKQITISGNKITKDDERTFFVNSSGSHTFSQSDSVAITKVIGYNVLN